MPTRMDYTGMEAFIAIAQLGNFARAADHLNLSQAALSHRIRKLETEMGIQLLLRTTREVSLTAAGQELLPVAPRSFENLAMAYSAVQTRGQAQRYKLAFACLPTVAHFYLPSLLDRFACANPKLTIQMQDQPASRITELVLEGAVEFGVTLIGALPWDLEFSAIRREPYFVLVGPKHRLAAQKSVTRDDLAGERFVRINTQSTNRRMLDDFLGPVAETIDWKFDVQNVTMAMAMVLEGAAVTVLPSLTAKMGAGQLVGLPFSDVDMYRTLGIITRRGAPLSDAAQSLRDQIVDLLGHVES